MSRLRWSIVLVALLPMVCASWAKSPPRDDDARLAVACRHAAGELRERLGPECRVITRVPFVLGGDFDETELARCYAEIVEPAVHAMQASYFDSRPTEAVTVLVFRNAESYDGHSQKLFGQSRISPFGYYKPNYRTLVLNRERGDGTLLHELTHALVDFDFPDAPTWLNEGLASLHEASRFRQSREGPWLEGVTNWRLPALQTAIRQERVRPIVELISEPDFRGRLEGTNYAQARYLCMYLQERELLRTFYRAFRENRFRDPRGLATLQHVLGPAGWRSIDQDFRRWTLELAQ